MSFQGSTEKRTAPRALTDEEIQALTRALLDEKESCNGVKRFHVLRDTIAIFLGLYCGLRQGDVRKLRVSQVWANDLPLDNLEIPPNFNKKNMGGFVAIRPIIQEVLKEYIPLVLEHRAPEDLDPILVVARPGMKRNVHSGAGRAYRTDPGINRPTFAAMTAHWNYLSKIKDPWTFHTLRHTFATKFLERYPGAIKQLSIILRHRDIASTSVYLHPTGKTLKDMVMNMDGPLGATP